MKKIVEKYRHQFSENRFWRTISRVTKAASVKLVYSALLLYFAYQRSDTPGWAKRIVLGSLGYLIMMVDLIPDLTPILGLTDDMGILSFGLVTIATYVNEEVRNQAREKLGQWFGEIDEASLQEVDDQL